MLCRGMGDYSKENHKNTNRDGGNDSMTVGLLEHSSTQENQVKFF